MERKDKEGEKNYVSFHVLPLHCSLRVNMNLSIPYHKASILGSAPISEQKPESLVLASLAPGGWPAVPEKTPGAGWGGGVGGVLGCGICRTTPDHGQGLHVLYRSGVADMERTAEIYLSPLRSQSLPKDGCFCPTLEAHAQDARSRSPVGDYRSAQASGITSYNFQSGGRAGVGHFCSWIRLYRIHPTVKHSAEWKRRWIRTKCSLLIDCRAGSKGRSVYEKKTQITPILPFIMTHLPFLPRMFPILVGTKKEIFCVIP